MTTARAEISCPATSTWLLPIDMALGQPSALPLAVNSAAQVAHGPLLITNETVTRSQFTIGRNTEVTRARTARVGPVGPAM
jgi:hypothetical protein